MIARSELGGAGRLSHRLTSVLGHEPQCDSSATRENGVGRNERSFALLNGNGG